MSELQRPLFGVSDLFQSYEDRCQSGRGWYVLHEHTLGAVIWAEGEDVVCASNDGQILHMNRFHAAKTY